ncbi:arylamine N-acetyltransferase family protein [Ectobacillus panaciterrae]|uniref:arylamine N-acetyltransferase family protein n=1 Tax=Ectobacillus panaciterrae TaxID=363872 RepID=UPI00041E3C3F|nr:arylamine N-acetyltransferase [Ectobacillus panaciterrae]
MTELNALFRKRIGIPENEKITFETLDHVLEKTAKTIPFENLCIIANKTNDVTKENVVDKILVRNEGGLCYELNSIFHFFLVENGFSAALVRGVVYDSVAQSWPTLGRTHVTNLLIHDGQTYLVDTGFGANLPLRPVPLNGEAITSSNGEFRIKKVDSDHGDHILEVKLKHKDPDWKIGYAFDSKRPVKDVTEFNEIQKILIEEQESPFNKNPLITRLTDEGHVTLTDTSFTQWTAGKVMKETIDHRRFKELAKQHFGIE